LRLDVSGWGIITRSGLDGIQILFAHAAATPLKIFPQACTSDHGIWEGCPANYF